MVKGGLTRAMWDDMVNHKLEVSHICGNNCMDHRMFSAANITEGGLVARIR
jgi:hypothetical protein